MSLEFVKNENYISLTASVGRGDLWYSIDYPALNFVKNAAVVDSKWTVTRNRPLPTPSVKLGTFDSLEEAEAACRADLASNPK